MPHWLWLILWTLVPALELRFSIPWGVYREQYPWPVVALICVAANIALGFGVFFFIEEIIKLMTLWKPVGRLWDRYVERTQKKIHAKVEKYGEWAVAVFIGIPLPGSGVYSGALASYLIGLPFRKFVVANILGVLIAGAVVTAVSVLGIESLSFFIKPVE
jgi:uncharacterized membrane protein